MLGKLIERPIAVTMTMIMLVVVGLVSINMLPVSLIPEVDAPYITVSVSAPERSAIELNKSVVGLLRQQLLQVSGLRDITTETRDGSATITLSFDHGVNTDFIFIETNEKIDRAMGSLPRDIERPNVMKANTTDIPAFYINLTLRDDDRVGEADPLFPVSEKFFALSQFANNVIVKRIEQLPQVAMVDVSGYVTDEILIIPDRDRLRSFGIEFHQFESVIKDANLNLGNLVIRDGEYQYNVNVQNFATTREEIEQLHLKISDRLIQVGDLARVIQHPRPLTNIIDSDGKTALVLAVIKQSDAKMAHLKREIGKLLESFGHDYPEIEFTVTRDQTELLDYSINNLLLNIIMGVVLVSVIIFLFMQSLRSSLIVVITIPLALILSMLFFYLIGISINIISLSGLVLGVGMMVDNSIVVIDNITFRWNSGYNLKEAVVKGTGEVFAPMLSSVLTTCAVFVPLIFLSGVAGTLFFDQAMAVTITLFCSLAVTVTVIPVYYYLLFRSKARYTPNRFIERISFDKVIPFYEKVLVFFFRHRWVMWSVLGCLVLASVLIYGDIRKERLPDMTYTDVLVNIDWNEKITVGENHRRALTLTENIKEKSSQITVFSADQQFVLPHTKKIGINESVIYIRQAEGGDIEDIKNDIADFLMLNYPDCIYSFETSGNIFDMVFAEKQATLTARIRSTEAGHPDPHDLSRLLGRLQQSLPDIEIDKIPLQETLLYVAKPELMTLYGVTYQELLALLKNSLNSNLLFSITEGNRFIPVIIGDNTQSISDILADAAIVRDGARIPAAVFLTETRSLDLKSLVSGPEGDFYPVDLAVDDKQVPGIMTTIREETEKDPAFEVSFSGTYFSNRKMIRELSLILVVSLLLLYFILASQFESLLQPLIILSEILLDIAGVIIALWALGISLNIMSLIGIVVTCGIVINDSILKVDTINRLRRNGMSLTRSIMVAGKRRLKAIVMTSLTTILAVAPFLVRGDMGSDLQYPLSVAVIAGMVVGTLASIFFVPLIYYVIYRKK